MYSGYKSAVEEHMMQGSMMSFMYRVYGWMSAALIVSASVAYYVSTVPTLARAIVTSTPLFIGIFVAQIAMVVVLSMFINKLSYASASILFMVYAASLGLTLSVVFLAYTLPSVAITFLVTAGMFGTMCVYGYLTKTDLTTVRSLGTMALFGIMIGFLVNMYFKSEMADYVMSGIGVLIFTALTAADMQKIKQMGYQLLSDAESSSKVAILGALTLYLDFINLFLMLLRFMGNRRD